MNLEEKSILANQVIEPFDLAQLQQNVRLTRETELARYLPSKATANGVTKRRIGFKRLLDVS